MVVGRSRDGGNGALPWGARGTDRATPPGATALHLAARGQVQCGRARGRGPVGAPGAPGEGAVASVAAPPHHHARLPTPSYVFFFFNF